MKREGEMAYLGREKLIWSIKIPGREDQMDFLDRSNEKGSDYEVMGEDREKQAPGAEYWAKSWDHPYCDPSFSHVDHPWKLPGTYL